MANKIIGCTLFWPIYLLTLKTLLEGARAYMCSLKCKDCDSLTGECISCIQVQAPNVIAYKLSENVCHVCPEWCIDCSVAPDRITTVCNTCVLGKVIDGKCYLCPIVEVLNVATKKCEKPADNCYMKVPLPTGELTCVGCVSGFQPQDGICVLIPPETDRKSVV